MPKPEVPRYNIVVVMDFDTTHASKYVQNVVRRTGQIARCYHFDSHRNDLLQCVDLLLGAFVYLMQNPMCVLNFSDLQAARKSGQRLGNSDIRKLLAGHLGNLMESKGESVYSLDA